MADSAAVAEADAVDLVEDEAADLVAVPPAVAAAEDSVPTEDLLASIAEVEEAAAEDLADRVAIVDLMIDPAPVDSIEDRAPWVALAEIEKISDPTIDSVRSMTRPAPQAEGLIIIASRIEAATETIAEDFPRANDSREMIT